MIVNKFDASLCVPFEEVIAVFWYWCPGGFEEYSFSEEL
jgi:hypothetical protein